MMANSDLTLPVAGVFMFSALGLHNPYVYRFENNDRWCVRADGAEYWLILLPDGGLQLVDNPF